MNFQVLFFLYFVFDRCSDITGNTSEENRIPERSNMSLTDGRDPELFGKI